MNKIIIALGLFLMLLVSETRAQEYELVWSDVKYIANDVMMNKPTVLSTGEWLFPLAVWNYDATGYK